MNGRNVEIFSAGCPVCRGIIDDIRRVADPSWKVTVLDMNETRVAERAKRLGIRSIPAVVVNGRLADCCAARGVDMETLKTMGIADPAF